MTSTVISVTKFDLAKLKTIYLQVNMEFDNRKNAAYAILNKLSRDILQLSEQFGGCLAHPQRDLTSIMMVIDPIHLKNESIVEFLDRQKILIKLEIDCDSLTIEKCLSFSMFYFMEKAKWFRLGESFVPDGFLWWKQSNLSRIQFQSHCSASGNIYLKLSAEMVRIFAFDHWILDADERFPDLHSGPITREVRQRWVSCLPRLGKGRILRVHRSIPDTAPFETYEQMKSYWKKTYGYELPPAEPEVYYDILFNNGQSMLYPFYCVLTGPPEVISCRATSSLTKEALELFLKAFREAEIVICGNSLSTEQSDSQSIKSYLDVVAMQSSGCSRLKKEEKVSRKKEENPSIRKIYPKIPTGLKRSGSSSSDNAPAVKKTRPNCGISFD